MLQTLIVNWDFVGGSRGAYIIRPADVPILGSYIQYLFLVMLVLAVVALATARIIERSRLGYGFATIRDDELAAEACGVPTLRLKLIATTISGALMGMAGAPFPYYIGYLEPSSAFGLAYAVNSIAMPMIGGTTSWVGPLVGALLLGTLQQVATVTISSAVNLLIVGLLLVGFVIVAPKRHRRPGAGFHARAAPPTAAADLALAARHFRQHAAGSALMAEPLLQVENLGKRFGGFVALDGINLSVQPGERVGLIGPNGSGKSTLVNCMCGTLQNESGTVRFDGHVDGRARRPTSAPIAAWRAASSCRGRSQRCRSPRTCAFRCSTPRTARSGRHLSHEEIASRCHELAGLVGLAAKANKLPRDLTQVEMRKLELARAMAADPKLLIADEAMAGLSQSEVDDIVALLIKLNERGITIILIEHIMRAVMSFSQRLVVLVSGKKIADGAPQEVVSHPEVIGAYLGQ